MKLIYGLTTFLAALAAVEAVKRPHVDAAIHRTLRSHGTVNIVVTMRGGVETVMESLKQESSFKTRGEKITHTKKALEAHAATSQMSITQFMAKESSAILASEMKSFWLTNQVYFKDATFELVENLASDPTVDSIHEEILYPAPAPVKRAANATADATVRGGIEWGVARVQAPDVWVRGFTGQGIVIGSIDSGVRATHEAIRHNFRREFGWFDPEFMASEPYDTGGHGTHTMGTIAGSGGIGVAPGVQWITCKACRSTGFCPESDLIECSQFMICPSNPSRTTFDCSKAPQVINNSWGGAGGSTGYKLQTGFWNFFDIVPVFSIGNSGEDGCQTAGSPGDLNDVIGVGSTDVNDVLSSFSSRGPSLAGLTKPEISAPGSEVRSSTSASDNSYDTWSGTSMAAPHMTGAVALVLSREPTLNVAQVRLLLFASTDTNPLQASYPECGGTPNGKYPNNMYGFGRVNAFKAFKSMGWA